MDVGFFVEIEARADKVADVEQFLQEGLALVEGEAGMIEWLAVRTGPTTFMTINRFADTGDRAKHLEAELATRFGARADELLAMPPRILEHEVIAQKLPK